MLGVEYGKPLPFFLVFNDQILQQLNNPCNIHKSPQRPLTYRECQARLYIDNTTNPLFRPMLFVTYLVPAILPSAANHSRRAVGCSEFPFQWPAVPESWTSVASVVSITQQTLQVTIVASIQQKSTEHTRTHTTVLRPFFQDHPGERVPEENFWTSWCKERLTEADSTTIRLDATPSGLTSAHLHRTIFYRLDALPTTQPTVSKH